MAQHMNAAVDEDAALLQFPKEFENAETLLISEVNLSDAPARGPDVGPMTFGFFLRFLLFDFR